MTLSSDRPSTLGAKPDISARRTPSPIYLLGTDCAIQPQVSLAPLTTFRVGGKAQWYVAPRSWDELQASLEWYQSQDLPLTFLGVGSNLLVSDRGIPGLVLSTRNFRASQFDQQTGLVSVSAGEPIARLAWRAAKRGWRGLEWAVGIPGTVGGAVVMNAGAHGHCIAELLVGASVVSANGTLEELTAEELAFSYRTSILQGDRRLVSQATFQLKPGFSASDVMASTNHNLQQRMSSQPYDKPSCGSVFRNPESHAAGWLIEKTGLKGYQIGGAQVAHRHANFILNCGGATADDIFRLINHVQETVNYHWSLLLEPEVKMLGEF